MIEGTDEERLCVSKISISMPFRDLFVKTTSSISIVLACVL